MDAIARQMRGTKSRAVTWIARVVLAIVFVAASVPKLAGSPSQVELFRQVGMGQELRYFVGAAELAGALGVLVPRLAWLATGGLALDMVGATVVNIVLGNPGFAMTVPLLAVSLAVFLSLRPPVVARRLQAPLVVCWGHVRGRSRGDGGTGSERERTV